MNMLRDTFFLVYNDVLYLLRRRETWLWTFVMPVLFIYFFGTVLSGFWKSADTKDIIGVSVPSDAGFLVDSFIRQLEARNYQIIRVTPDAAEQYTRRLTIPAGFTESVLSARPVKLELIRAGNNFTPDYDQMRIR